MKENELRIGSTYHSVKFNQPVKLTAYDISELVRRSDGANISHYIDEIMKPIPLTEEWLGKVGIYNKYKKEFGISFDRYDLFIDLSNRIFLRYDDNQIIQLKSIKYVHELQNIYFALAGKELE